MRPKPAILAVGERVGTDADGPALTPTGVPQGRQRDASEEHQGLGPAPELGRDKAVVTAKEQGTPTPSVSWILTTIMASKRVGSLASEDPVDELSRSDEALDSAAVHGRVLTSGLIFMTRVRNCVSASSSDADSSLPRAQGEAHAR